MMIMPGLVINGQWKTKNAFADEKDGKFKRDDSAFRDTIDENSEFKPESGRYHLYVSLACPWAHRTLIFRRLKDLESHIDVSVVHPHMLDDGWTFDTNFDGATGDLIYKHDFLYQIYTKAKLDYSGKVTVPVLWDKKTKTIVNNESSEIIRIFNTAFNNLTGNDDNYYPGDLKSEIDEINERVYNTVNNGVYKAGFATNQEAYDKPVKELFDSLQWLESILSDGREYICGDKLTEADIRLLPTLLRFDAVYHTHFKCNIDMIVDFKFLQDYMVRLYEEDFVKPTVDMAHIKNHYYKSHPTLNPNGIISAGPDLNWL